MLAHGTHDLPDQTVVEAEPVLVEAASHLDPPRLRRAVAHLLVVADPDGADARAERRHDPRGLWLRATFEGMVALGGLLDAEAGQIVLAALEPWPAPPAPGTTAAPGSGMRMRWLSWPAALWKPAASPRLVGSDPSWS